jgi:hypothetical protein
MSDTASFQHPDNGWPMVLVVDDDGPKARLQPQIEAGVAEAKAGAV